MSHLGLLLLGMTLPMMILKHWLLLLLPLMLLVVTGFRRLLHSPPGRITHRSRLLVWLLRLRQLTSLPSLRFIRMMGGLGREFDDPSSTATAIVQSSIQGSFSDSFPLCFFLKLLFLLDLQAPVRDSWSYRR